MIPHLHFQVIKFGPIDPYPDYWVGGNGQPLAFDDHKLYPDDRSLFTHPIAFGPYLATARRIAKDVKANPTPIELLAVVDWEGVLETFHAQAVFDQEKADRRVFGVFLPNGIGNCTGSFPLPGMAGHWSLGCDGGFVAKGSMWGNTWKLVGRDESGRLVRIQFQ